MRCRFRFSSLDRGIARPSLIYDKGSLPPLPTTLTAFYPLLYFVTPTQRTLVAPSRLGRDLQPPRVLPAHGRAELDLEMHTEPPAHSEKRSSSCLRRIESPVAFTVLDMPPNAPSLDLDFGPKVEAVPGAVCRRRNRPLSYGLNSPSPTPEGPA